MTAHVSHGPWVGVAKSKVKVVCSGRGVRGSGLCEWVRCA